MFEGVKKKGKLFGGMLITRIARGLGILNPALISAMTHVDPPHQFVAKSLMDMKVVMSLGNRGYAWPKATNIVEEEGDDDEEDDAEDEQRLGEEDVRGMSEREWRAHQAGFMERQDAEWEKFREWKEQQEARDVWTYNHMVRLMEYTSVQGNLDPPLQIDPYPGLEHLYPPHGYSGNMPPGYSHREDSPHDGTS